MSGMRNRFLLLILAISVSYTSAFAVNVIWDQSHGPMQNYALDEQYSMFAEWLINNDYTLQANNDGLLADGLWDTDILVVSIKSNFQSEYTDAEIDRIVSFVEAGGSLVVLSDMSNNGVENINPLLAHFGMESGLEDELEDLTFFEQHDLTQDLNILALQFGSEIGILDNNENVEIIGYDDNDLAGMAVYQADGGKVVLIGDADLWTTDLIELGSNLQFASNCFAGLSRERNGNVEINANAYNSHILGGNTDEFRISISNTGDGLAEVGLSIAGESNWLSFDWQYATISPNEEITATARISSEGIEPGNMVEETIIINHNTPDSVPFEIPVSLQVLPTEPVHFVTPFPTGQDHSLLIRELTIDDILAEPGIEIGVFTPDGICAGAVVYFGDASTGLAASADDGFTDELEGFLSGEDFHFRLYIPWEDTEIPATPDFIEGSSHFSIDGFSALNLNGGTAAQLTLNFPYLWTIVSLNVVPNRLNMLSILEPLLESGNLKMVKDGRGHFWSVEHGYSNIAEWDMRHGYEIMVAHPTRVEVAGVMVDPSTPITVEPGWNIVAYLPQQPMETSDAVASLDGNLRLVKRDDGMFYAPEWDFDCIGALMPGKGYKIAMTAQDELVYPEAQGMLASAPTQSKPVVSSENMSILLMGISEYNAIRVISESGEVFGYTETNGSGKTGFAVWGDSELTPAREGFLDDELFRVQAHSGNEWKDVEIQWLEGESIYTSDGFSVGKLKSTGILPETYGFTAFPNPFNSTVTLSVKNVERGAINVSTYDVAGRLVHRAQFMADDNNGVAQISLNADNLPSGVLLLKVENNGNSNTQKVLHLP